MVVMTLAMETMVTRAAVVAEALASK